MSNSPPGLMTQEQWSSYLLDWCWSTNATKLLEFDTGNTYLVAKFQPVYFTEAASTNAFWQILFDNQEIYQIEVTGAVSFL